MSNKEARYVANIFEQFGIQEIVDATLYAIALDKYDNEIYIPVLYLNTLKLSTLSQNASQSSAKGGHGNPDLITWDFGKEIDLKLQDALFTPASQSMMWGGKFGIKKPKIQGLWNPLVYPKDRYGRTKYLEKHVLAYVDSDGENPAGFYELLDGQKVSEEPIIACEKLDTETYVGAIRFNDDPTAYGEIEDQNYDLLAAVDEQDIAPASTQGNGGRLTNIKLTNVQRYVYTDANSNTSFIFAILDDITAQAYKSICETVMKAAANPNWATENHIVVTGTLSELALPATRSVNYCNEHKGDIAVFSKANFLMENPSTELEQIISKEIIGKFKDYIPFICPCDGQIKYATYIPVEAEFKYEDIEEFATGYRCPKGYETGERESSESNTAALVKSYYWGVTDNALATKLEELYDLNPQKYRGRPERAEIACETYGDFDFTLFDMQVMKGTKDGDTITIDETLSDDADKFCIYTPVDRCDGIYGDNTVGCGSDVHAYGYEWKRMDMKMMSFEGDQDLYYMENANLRFRVPRNSTQKEISIARDGFYETEYNQETITWDKVGEEEINSIITLDRQFAERQSYGYFVNPYDSSVQFFINIHLTLPLANDQNSLERTIRVPLGTFYIVSDWNYDGVSAYEIAHPIESGIEHVHMIEVMKEYKATATFAIDANKNLAMGNYRYVHAYDECPLTVFIDPKTMKPYEANSGSFVRENGDVITGNFRIIKQNEMYYKWTRSIAPPFTSLGQRIIVDAEHFPGTFRIVGETHIRPRDGGKDDCYQIELPLAKLSPETSLELVADSGPATFDMNFKVLRRDDGVMVKLTRYRMDCMTYDGHPSGSEQVVPLYPISDSTFDTIVKSEAFAELRVISPDPTEVRQMSTEHDIAIEDIQAVLDTTKSVTEKKYNTYTLQVVEENYAEALNTEPLNDEDIEVVIANMDEEVGE